jgi:hypothetical protein
LHKEASNIKKGNLKLSVDFGKTEDLVLVVLTQRKLEFYLIDQKPGKDIVYKFHSYVDLKHIKKVKKPKGFDKEDEMEVNNDA